MRSYFSRLVLSGMSIAVLLSGSRESRADLIYDDGPINGAPFGRLIGAPAGVFFTSDSFTVSSEANLTSVEHAGMETSFARAPTGVIWWIGTSSFSNDVSSGFSSISSSYFGTVAGYTVYDTSFAISGTVGPGTYYLTLFEAQAFGSLVFWDVNFGPSTAFSSTSAPNSTISVPAESFQIYGDPVVVPPTVPEPSTLALLMLGGLGMGLGVRRSRRAMATN